MNVKKPKKTGLENYTDIGAQLAEKETKIDHSRVTIRELSNEMNKDYMSTLIDTALEGKKKYTGTFYVVVLTKRERLIAMSLRNYFIARKSCPTPNYEQAVYRFNAKDEALDFIWMVPSKDLWDSMYLHRLDLELQSDSLLPHVVDYVEGKLFDKTIKLNVGDCKIDPTDLYPLIK